ncbi:hypothetical protein AHiyo4_44070 [Arthrobacter sp. Hiyo4]|nr:hypothetical protein AHiyo4_44070 [Arthrobacter sp. Hiyo4]
MELSGTLPAEYRERAHPAGEPACTVTVGRNVEVGIRGAERQVQLLAGAGKSTTLFLSFESICSSSFLLLSFSALRKTFIVMWKFYERRGSASRPRTRGRITGRSQSEST